jgi:alpha-galactosidase
VEVNHPQAGADNLARARRTSAELAASDLDHDEWNKASAVRLTRYWSGEEAPPARHAEVRILWSASALSVRFVCPQEEPLVVSDSPQVSEKTLGLWDRDVCEIFVAPEARRPQQYMEFEAAPTGEWLDLAIESKLDGRETDWHYDSGMTVAARIGRALITIAIRIPWTAFGRAPVMGERWRANLFRCVGAGAERGYIAWQPTRTVEPNFHVPAVFGWLEFDDRDD